MRSPFPCVKESRQSSGVPLAHEKNCHAARRKESPCSTLSLVPPLHSRCDPHTTTTTTHTTCLLLPLSCLNKTSGQPTHTGQRDSELDIMCVVDTPPPSAEG